VSRACGTHGRENAYQIYIGETDGTVAIGRTNIDKIMVLSGPETHVVER
jgi:hypothetical protein